MTSPIVSAASRRCFLQYLASSPLLASGALSAYGAETPSRLPDPMVWAPPGSGDLIKSPKEAINVFEFEPVCRQNVPPAHFGYMASGLDDEVTLRANREGFLKFQLNPHRLNDVSKVDTSVELFGTRYNSPIFVCPTEPRAMGLLVGPAVAPEDFRHLDRGNTAGAGWRGPARGVWRRAQNRRHRSVSKTMSGLAV